MLAAILPCLSAASAMAHTEHQHGPAAQKNPLPRNAAIGKPGDARKIDRTITVDMLDTMRFGPADISVRRGETIRFVVVNKGVLPHELVLGTPEELKAHAEDMRKNPHAGHDDAAAVRVEPGQKKEIVWEFTTPGTVDFGCLLPGHFEAGMVGKVKVAKN